MRLLVCFFISVFTVVGASRTSWYFDGTRFGNNGDRIPVSENIDGQLKTPLMYIRFASVAAAAIIANQTSSALDPSSLDMFEIDTVGGGESRLVFHRSFRTRQYLIQPDLTLICAIPGSPDLSDDTVAAPNKIIRLGFTTERNWEPSPGLTSRGVVQVGNFFPSNFLMIPSANHPTIYLHPFNLNRFCSGVPGYVALGHEQGMVVRLSARINSDNDFISDGSHNMDSSWIEAFVRIGSSVDFIPPELFTRIVRQVHDDEAGTYLGASRSRDFLRGGTLFRNCTVNSFPTIVYTIKSAVDDNTDSFTNLVLYPEDYVEMQEGSMNCIARILPATSRQYNSFGPRGTIGLNVFKNVVGIFEPGNRVGFCEPL